MQIRREKNRACTWFSPVQWNDKQITVSPCILETQCRVAVEQWLKKKTTTLAEIGVALTQASFMYSRKGLANPMQGGLGRGNVPPRSFDAILEELLPKVFACFDAEYKTKSHRAYEKVPTLANICSARFARSLYEDIETENLIVWFKESSLPEDIWHSLLTNYFLLFIKECVSSSLQATQLHCSDKFFTYGLPQFALDLILTAIPTLPRQNNDEVYIYAFYLSSFLKEREDTTIIIIVRHMSESRCLLELHTKLIHKISREFMITRSTLEIGNPVIAREAALVLTLSLLRKQDRIHFQEKKEEIPAIISSHGHSIRSPAKIIKALTAFQDPFLVALGYLISCKRKIETNIKDHHLSNQKTREAIEQLLVLYFQLITDGTTCEAKIQSRQLRFLSNLLVQLGHTVKALEIAPILLNELDFELVFRNSLKVRYLRESDHNNHNNTLKLSPLEQMLLAYPTNAVNTIRVAMIASKRNVSYDLFKGLWIKAMGLPQTDANTSVLRQLLKDLLAMKPPQIDEPTKQNTSPQNLAEIVDDDEFFFELILNRFVRDLSSMSAMADLYKELNLEDQAKRLYLATLKTCKNILHDHASAANLSQNEIGEITKMLRSRRKALSGFIKTIESIHELIRRLSISKRASIMPNRTPVTTPTPTSTPTAIMPTPTPTGTSSSEQLKRKRSSLDDKDEMRSLDVTDREFKRKKVDPSTKKKEDFIPFKSPSHQVSRDGKFAFHSPSRLFSEITGNGQQSTEAIPHGSPIRQSSRHSSPPVSPYQQKMNTKEISLLEAEAKRLEVFLMSFCFVLHQNWHDVLSPEAIECNDMDLVFILKWQQKKDPVKAIKIVEGIIMFCNKSNAEYLVPRGLSEWISDTLRTKFFDKI